jgi:type VI secretion system protein
MAGHSLLTRIRHPEYAVARRSIPDSELRDAILIHLRQICSTRCGGMVTCPDYGVIDVSELVTAFPDAIADMAKALKHTILTYEPRLRNVRVVHVPTEDMTLRYEVSAQLMRGQAVVPVSFVTSIDPSRNMKVR